MDAFAALADPVRRDLLLRLHVGEARVVDLANEHAISRPAISRHLRQLLDAGLVTAADHGRERHYRLRLEGLAPVQSLLGALTTRALPESVLDGLDLEVRRTTRERATASKSQQRQHDSPTERKTS